VVRIAPGLASVDRWLVSGGRCGRASRGQHRPLDTNQRLKLFWGQNLVKKALRNTCDFPHEHLLQRVPVGERGWSVGWHPSWQNKSHPASSDRTAGLAADGGSRSQSIEHDHELFGPNCASRLPMMPCNVRIQCWLASAYLYVEGEGDAEKDVPTPDGPKFCNPVDILQQYITFQDTVYSQTCWIVQLGKLEKTAPD